MFALGAHEPVDHLAINHRVHRGYRLHLERLTDTRVGINVDLGQLYRSVGFGDDLFEDGSELFARPAPLGPKVDNNRNGLGPFDHVDLECCVSYISHCGLQRIGQFCHSRLWRLRLR